MSGELPRKYDAAIVGAGPAGITAALRLARAGIRTIVFERGELPGQKNVSGCLLHWQPALHELIPDFCDAAPIERRIIRYRTTLLSAGGSAFSFEHDSALPASYHGFSLVRGRFDPWYAQRAQEAGAVVVGATTVEDLLWRGRQVIGVRTGRRDGDVLADCVVIADGANSLLAEKSHLAKPGELVVSDYSVAAKEVLELPPGAIEERFNVTGDEGEAVTFVGDCTRGVQGGAFLYTNKTTISLGVVANLEALTRRRMSITDLLDWFKAHSTLQRLLKDATLRERSGHLLPGAHVHRKRRLFGDGILLAGDAGGFLCSTGFSFEGMSLAMASGAAAADIIVAARKDADFSSRRLAGYAECLDQYRVSSELARSRRAASLLASPLVYEAYPEIACRLGAQLYRGDGRTNGGLLAVVWGELKKRKMSLWQFVRDLARGVVTVLWPSKTRS